MRIGYARVSTDGQGVDRHCYFNESADVTYSLAHLSCGFQARDFAPHVSGGLS